MYLADSFGYLGYVAVVFGRGAVQSVGSLLDLFVMAAWTVSLGGLLCFSCAGLWFLRTVPAAVRPRVEPA
jgi:hypothetical protein